MKILSAAETRKADAFTIEHEPIKSIDLMQRASEAFVKAFINLVDKHRPVLVFCGTGNNGGDGLAISRLLHQKGYKIRVYIIQFEGKGSKDFLINYNRHFKILKPVLINNSEEIPEFSSNQVIIDAIFGSGLTREVTGLHAKVIRAINQSGNYVISIDIASGLFADDPSDKGAIIEPDKTISFQMPKLAFLIPENRKYTGDWDFVNIGLNMEYINSSESNNYWMTREYWEGTLTMRSQFSHKGDFGKALIVAGGKGKMGAAILAAKGCLRAGVGLLTLHVPGCGYSIVQTSVPEAMTTIDLDENKITSVPYTTGFDTIGIGPGIGKDSETLNMIDELLTKSKSPMVIDADALNLIGENRRLLEKIPHGSILTPHLVEFERISGPCTNHFDRLKLQKDFSIQHGVILVLKGAYTSISFPDGKTFFNSTGNPGMATGGSGDVLTGIITGLLAGPFKPEEAALLGVYLHGLAGDLACKDTGEDSLIASDIIAYIPKAFLTLKKIINSDFISTFFFLD